MSSNMSGQSLSFPTNATSSISSDALPLFRCFFVYNDIAFRNAPIYHKVVWGTAVFNSLCSSTAVLGNTLALAAILKSSSLRKNPSSVLLFSLAMTDFFVGLIVQPAFVMRCVAWLLKNVSLFCVSGLISETLGPYFSFLSFMTVAAISLERYLALVLHMTYQSIVSFGRIIGFCIFLWVFPIPFLTLRFFAEEGSFFNWFPSFTIAFMSLFGFLSTVAVGISYIGIFSILHRHNRQIQDQTKATNNSQRRKDLAKYRKSVSGMVYVLIAFILSYSPYLICTIIGRVSGYTDPQAAAMTITASMILFNSSLNPVLYCCRIAEIRLFVKAFFRSIEFKV